MRGKKYIWSEEQLNTIRELYPTECICDIAERMGLSTHLVRSKAIAMGLKRDASFDCHKNYGRYTKKGNHFNGRVEV